MGRSWVRSGEGWRDVQPDPYSQYGQEDDAAEPRSFASQRGRGPRGYVRSDGRILEEIHERMTEDDRLDASDIEVEVRDGEVTLLGVVASREAKHLAEDIAEEVSGVRHVQNNIRLAKGGAGFGSAAGAHAGGMG